MTWDRRKRQEAILQERIAVIVQHHLSDPRLGFVTITGTELSRDKRRCKVFYTVLGEDSARRKTSRALVDSAPRIQEILGPRLEMRTLPELVFVYDEGIEKERRILGLMETLEAERGDFTETEPTGDPEGQPAGDPDGRVGGGPDGQGDAMPGVPRGDHPEARPQGDPADTGEAEPPAPHDR